MKKKGCTWRRQTTGECCELFISLVPVHPLLSSMAVLFQYIVWTKQNALLKFFQISHRYCLHVGVITVVLSSKSDTVVTSTYILPLTIIFTHLLISSRANFWYSLCHKHLGNFAFDSDTNSVTNENSCLELKSLPWQNRILIPFRIACTMDRTKPLFKSCSEPASKSLF